MAHIVAVMLVYHRRGYPLRRCEELYVDSATQIFERNDIRIRVRDTDLGRKMQQQIDDLQSLLTAYGKRLIQESC
jgi:fructose-1,6-bisphosphatase